MDVDAWLPHPHVRTRHRREASASPGALWEAARGVRLDETRTLGRLVRWRIPGTPASITFAAMLAGEPFCLLGEGDGWSVSGLAGSIWTPRRRYGQVAGREDFDAWSESGTVRVLFAHWVEPSARGSALVSEARVAAVDRRAALRLRALWAVVGPFERLIGAEPLALAARRAEGA